MVRPTRFLAAVLCLGLVVGCGQEPDSTLPKSFGTYKANVASADFEKLWGLISEDVRKERGDEVKAWQRRIKLLQEDEDLANSLPTDVNFDFGHLSVTQIEKPDLLLTDADRTAWNKGVTLDAADAVTIQMDDGGVIRFKGKNADAAPFTYRVGRDFGPVAATAAKPTVVHRLKIRFNDAAAAGQVLLTLGDPTGNSSAVVVSATLSADSLIFACKGRANGPGQGLPLDQTVLAIKVPAPAAGATQPTAPAAKAKTKHPAVGHWFEIRLTAYLAASNGKAAGTYDVTVTDMDRTTAFNTVSGVFFSEAADGLGRLRIASGDPRPTQLDFDVAEPVIAVAAAKSTTLFDEPFDYLFPSYGTETPIDGRKPDDGNPAAWQAEVKAHMGGADPAGKVTIVATADGDDRFVRVKGRTGEKPERFTYRAQRGFKTVPTVSTQPIVTQRFRIRFNEKRVAETRLKTADLAPAEPKAGPTANLLALAKRAAVRLDTKLRENGTISVRMLDGDARLTASLIEIVPEGKKAGILCVGKVDAPGKGSDYRTPVLPATMIRVGHWYEVRVTAYLTKTWNRAARTYDVAVADLNDPTVKLPVAKNINFYHEVESLGLVRISAGSELTDAEATIQAQTGMKLADFMKADGKKLFIATQTRLAKANPQVFKEAANWKFQTGTVDPHEPWKATVTYTLGSQTHQMRFINEEGLWKAYELPPEVPAAPATQP